MGIVFWVAGVVLVLAGAVGLARGRTPEGVILIVAGLLTGPVAVSMFLPPPGS